MVKIQGCGVLVILFFLCLQTAGAQEVKFSIQHSGKEIGQVRASLIKTGDTHTYEVISNVDFRVLWKDYNRKTSNKVVYHDDMLQSSYNSVYMNDEMEDTSAIRHHQEKYHCFRYPEEKIEEPESKVEYSTVKLYFAEPVGITSIYSERFLAYCPLEKIGDQKYKLSLPNGKENHYTYANNKLVEVFVDRSWFDLKFLQQ